MAFCSNLGYDTTAQTLAYAGYELTKNPEVMKQLQDEVDAAYEEANGQTPDYSVVQVSKKPWGQSYKANFGINYCKFSYDIHPK